MVAQANSKHDLPSDSKSLAEEAAKARSLAEESKKIEQKKQQEEAIKNQARLNEEQKKKALEEARLAEEKKKKEEEEALKDHYELVNEESAAKIDQMNTFIAKFERSQKYEDYKKIKDMHEELRTQYHLRPKDIETHVDVASLMRAGFNEFPQIAHNDFAVDQINSINAYQENLNADIENYKMANNLIAQTQTVSEKLKDQYKDYWQNPFYTSTTSSEQ